MNRNVSKKMKEHHWFPLLIWLLPMVVMSGFATYFLPGSGIWKQWTYLLHSFSGTFLGGALLPYALWHFLRTLGTKRPWVSLSGILLMLVSLGLFGSGLHIMVFGQKESLRWIMELHLATAYIALFILAVHLGLYRWGPIRSRRKDPNADNPPFLRYWIISISSALGTFASIALVTFATSLFPSPYRDQAVVEPYEFPYGPHPFRPSQTETPNSSFLDARRVAGSEQCGGCHVEIANQWRSSLHSQAASDPAYVKNINLLTQKKGMAAARYCEGCHAPVALLSGQLTAGGFHGGAPGTLARQEGVSCLSCHGIDKVVHLKGVGSFRFSPQEELLFADRDSIILQKLHNFLIRVNPEVHRRDMSRPPLNNARLCATCHAQFMDKDMNNWGWVKMQDEYSAWLDSPYSGQSETSFAHATPTRCQDCHMPLVPGKDPSANPTGMIRSHAFPGANTAIPWITGDQKHLELNRRFLQTGKMRLTLEPPRRKDAIRSSSRTLVAPSLLKEPPSYFFLGENARIQVSVSNVQVGHDFPGGTIDINEAWIWFRVVDAENRLVYESGGLSETNDVDPDAHFYRSIPIDRFRNPVWRHDLFNMTGERFRNVIPAAETDIVEYQFSIPYWVSSPLTVSVVLRYRKFNNRYARWALDNDSVRLPIVDMARDSLILPIRVKTNLEKKIQP